MQYELQANDILRRTNQANAAVVARGFAVLDDKRFAAWLNDPMNRAWRTRTGVV